MHSLTEDQITFLLSGLNRDRKKLKWVIENKELDNEKKEKLRGRIKKITEIIITLEKASFTENNPTKTED